MGLRGAPDARESRILPEYWYFDGPGWPAYQDFSLWMALSGAIGADRP
jgi:hypothetical protein